ncbi:Ig-specific serine endopeptidase MIP [Mycoplasmopsis gallinarum]
MKKKNKFLPFLAANIGVLPIFLAASCFNKDNKKEEPNPDKPTNPTDPVNPTDPNQPWNRLSLSANDLIYKITPQNQNIINEYTKYEASYFNELIEQLSDKRTTDGKFFVDEKYKELKSAIPNVINAFNKQSETTYQPYYIDAFAKNFSLPNENQKLELNPIRGSKKRAWYNSTPGDRGRARYLSNDLYKQAAVETYSIAFSNSNNLINNDSQLVANIGGNKQFLGTSWILDYALDSNGYPTKWYLATNLHVALSLVKPATATDTYTNEPLLEQEYNELKEAYNLEQQLANEWKEIEKQYEQSKREKGENHPDTIGLAKQIEISLDNPRAVAYDRAKTNLTKIKNKIMGQTQAITISHFTENTPLNSNLKMTKFDANVESVTLKPEQVNIVYAGVNFLNESPNAYVANSNLASLEEMADFAVLEIDFSKQDPAKIEYATVFGNEQRTTKVNSVNELAQRITSGYANLEGSKQSKPANFDLLEKYNELANETVEIQDGDRTITTSRLNLNFVAVGFPQSDSDNQLDDNQLNDEEKYSKMFTSSLWTNKSIDLTKGTVQYGNSLSKSLVYRNFVNMPGITDIMITSPLINQETNSGFSVNNFKEKNAAYQNNLYLNYGLGYILTSWQPMGGGSGSSVRDIKNNILGLSYAIGDAQGNSLVAITQSLRSNGHNYQGQYGNYNLAKYDLIYGSAAGQRTSYREKMLEKYGSTFKTKLFKNGLNIVPEEYQFKG